MTLLEIAIKTKNTPLCMHINPIGLLRMGKTHTQRFQKLNDFLNSVQTLGGNIAVPAYSYSFAKKESYDIKNTPSKLDVASEYLRNQNSAKRTIDPNFSYLLFGSNFSNTHFKAQAYNSFGENSLIEEVFLRDGYLGAIGGALEYLTEIHFIERMLGVNYRFDKSFSGQTIHYDGKKTKDTCVYYCRDLTSDYDVSFVKLKSDLRNENLIEIWDIQEFKVKLEVIKFRDIYLFIKNKLVNNPKYLWEEKNNA